MWNIQDIKKKKKYVAERYKNCKDSNERDKLSYTLLGYTMMLENRGTRNYTFFRNFIDFITRGKYTLINDNITNKKYKFCIKQPMNESFYNFLIELCFNVFNTENVLNEPVNFKTIKNDFDKVKQVSRDFYKNLGDEEISSIGIKLLDKDELINSYSYQRSNRKNYYGMTHKDYVFNDAYLNVLINNNILDYTLLTHEIMHAIDFKMNPKLLNQIYPGFNEIPTYTIDYLTIDYLKSIGMNKNEVSLLARKKEDYIQSLAAFTLFRLRKQLEIPKLYDYKEQLSYEKIKYFLNPNVISDLLEIESAVIAYTLYCDIKETNSFDKLKSIIKDGLDPNKIPNFNKYGLSNELLLETSKKIGEYSRFDKKLIM